jgi:hypothetical protein
MVSGVLIVGLVVVAAQLGCHVLNHSKEYRGLEFQMINC